MVLACTPAGLPDDKRVYEGRWEGPGIRLEIRGDGHVEYIRVQAHVHRQILGSIRWFDGDDFIVGWPWWGTRFRVNKPPYFEDGNWKIMVNEAELVRITPLDEFIDV